MEEIQDKWRESTFIVSQPSSCEEHFLLPPLFYSYQIYVWMNLRAPPLLLLFMDGVWALLAFWFSGVDTNNRRQSTSSDEWSLTPPANQGGPLSLDSTLLLPGQRLMSTDGFRSLDSQQCVTRDRTHCFAANCRNPTAHASKRCLHCRHFYCATCASLSLTCPKSSSGHRFVSSMLTTRGREQPRTSSRVRKRKPKKEEGPPWECKQCTMINGPQVLVCLGCDTLREVDAQEGRNVCPMCTLVNEPGKTKCELCDTELVSQAQADEADTEES